MCFLLLGILHCLIVANLGNSLNLKHIGIGEVVGINSQAAIAHGRRNHAITEGAVNSMSRCIVCTLCSFSCPTDCLFVGRFASSIGISAR